MPHRSDRNARTAETVRPTPTVGRLLPWVGADDQPCYLLTDLAGDGPVSRHADRIEALQLAMSLGLLDHAEPLIDDPSADAGQLRFLAAQLLAALRDAVRIAESRGERLAQHRQSTDTEDAEEGAGGAEGPEGAQGAAGVRDVDGDGSGGGGDGASWTP
ncbi:hypothetical protein ACFC0M_23455 [Streptomyces sp. NPDC056149]|uniref:hypothetical protein n=1 Tax=unclassified Streptomyces TaxID=2593676 RepID=UPI0023816061|nr:hypothetical protein [Streptomyces sp. WZ-12]